MPHFFKRLADILKDRAATGSGYQINGKYLRSHCDGVNIAPTSSKAVLGWIVMALSLQVITKTPREDPLEALPRDFRRGNGALAI